MTARPGTIWLTGLAGSGKTTPARHLADKPRAAGIDNVLLDGEVLRDDLQQQYGHTLEDRFRVLEIIVEQARQAQREGRVVIVATISHKRVMRFHARRRLGRMLEVYLDCPVPVCARRDGKGHYRRALAGEYECFVGVTEPYEPSATPELIIDTATLSVTQAAARLWQAAVDFLAS